MVVISGTNSMQVIIHFCAKCAQRWGVSVMLFNIFINYQDDEADYTFSKSADDTKPEGTVDVTDGSAAIQRT